MFETLNCFLSVLTAASATFCFICCLWKVRFIIWALSWNGLGIIVANVFHPRHVIRVQQKRTVERNELNLCGLGSQLYKHVLNTDSFLFQLELFLPGLYKRARNWERQFCWEDRMLDLTAFSMRSHFMIPGGKNFWPIIFSLSSSHLDFTFFFECLLAYPFFIR